MLNVENGVITMTRGDSAYLNFRLTTQDGEAYQLQEGDLLRLTVRAQADSGLDNTDFGGLIRYAVPLESDDWRGYDEEYGLIYTEFVALLTDQIERLKKEVQALRQEVQCLKNQTGG